MVMEDQEPRLLTHGEATGGRAGVAVSPAGAEADSAADLIGDSEEFQKVLRKIPRLASSDATVLITGETGTGKELVAKAIHSASRRCSAPFIPINCGALPESLVENELFGHARGAYTGASGPGKGLLGEAEGGTLFLDELNSLPLSTQAKLLRFLQNREYRALGSTRLLQADVRIIGATNGDLRALVASGQFRADLFHRLHVLSLELPPLRGRARDIPVLAEHFLRIYGGLYGNRAGRISSEAVAVLQGYPWPGNVRELQSVIERAVLLAAGPEILPEDLDLAVDGGGADSSSQAAVRDTGPDGAVGLVFRDAKARAVGRFEREYLVQTMAAADGNVSRAARLSGMQRRDFQRLLKKHGIRRADDLRALSGRLELERDLDAGDR